MKRLLILLPLLALAGCGPSAQVRQDCNADLQAAWQADQAALTEQDPAKRALELTTAQAACLTVAAAIGAPFTPSATAPAALPTASTSTGATTP